MVKKRIEENRGPKIGFIGAGVVGTALAVRLAERGYPVIAAASRSKSSADKLAEAVKGCQAYESKQSVADACELVFVTTPDDEIAEAVSEPKWHPGQFVIHCSGVDSLDVLQKARDEGAYVGGFHPLQTFASLDKAIENLPGSTFALEAEETLLDTLKVMAESLEGNFVVLGVGDKPLYHAAAVIACNYTVTLMKMATDLWKVFGASPEQATKALMPLLHGTVNNIENVGLPDCLTGPIARGDIGTIIKHLEAIEEKAPEIASAYREMGLQTIPVALNKGKIDVARAEEMRLLLQSETKAHTEVL
ncbi:MAG: DUF2520 domain-containing protein [Dehalococcoidia bacterium]